MNNWDYENDQWMSLPPHLRHLPLFTRHKDLTSLFFRVLFAIFLKALGFSIYVRLKVRGEFDTLYKNYPRLLIISNHASHLDATSIAAAVPFRYWGHLYITAAKDYFFSNPLFAFFSKHCLGAIPIDRQDKKGEAVKLCLNLLSSLDRIWMIFFPEGTRSKDGKIKPFRRGISLFSEQSATPVLFLYVKGNSELWPKGRLLPYPGRLEIFVGPVAPPGSKEVLFTKYIDWVRTIDPNVQVAEPGE